MTDNEKLEYAVTALLRIHRYWKHTMALVWLAILVELCLIGFFASVLARRA